ncbi:MAG TPA: hypothetical protein VJ953_06070, partial [Saprospiraceae bacterium]|nr:hypothetical protein [Saprospiraceae bacterium]
RTAEKADTSGFQSNWQAEPELTRHFAGGDYWLNPLQAWQQNDGRLEVIAPGGDRNCVLLTRSLDTVRQSFATSVSIADQSLTENQDTADAWVGFQLGLQGEFRDYRDAAIHGRGLSAGLTRRGVLFIGAPDPEASVTVNTWLEADLHLSATPIPTNDRYTLRLAALQGGDTLATTQNEIHESWLTGLLALSCSSTFPKGVDWSAERPAFAEVPNLGKRPGGTFACSFADWNLSGPKVKAFPERSYGPILWTQYTLSDKTLKMSVQMMPLGNGNRTVDLLMDGKPMLNALVEAPGNNAIFHLEDWDDTQAYPFTVRYTGDNGQTFEYPGEIAANVVENKLKVASLSCVDDVGFPHQDLVDNVAAQDPDLLVFHGDQLYERVGGYGVERKSKLDYLRKWYVFGWSFRNLYRDRPVVIIPDDHDIFHGNLWGEGGKLANIELGYGYASQDDGGYKERPDFVNMVHRTQTGHLPDPVDPEPVLNDISVYFTNMNYRGVSFAILGDRQWKSAPKQYFPEAEIENGWPQNRSWNAKTDAYHPDAELLGPRQEAFLEDWVADWAPEVYMKAVISQSPFCNVATLPADIYHDKYVPGLPKYKKGEYPPDDRPVADFDSNGWPQNKRNKAIQTMRKAFALHFVGDQHLGSTGRYGTNEYDDGGYWIASPAVSNLWPRRWYPAAYGADGKPEDAPRYIGKYEDGFGNKISVRAVANPYDIDREPGKVFDKAPGFSIIEFDIPDRKLTLAAWPRWAAPAAGPYEGWPITISQQENYGRERAGILKTVEVDGETTVALFRESDDTLVYNLKPKAGPFEVFVFEAEESYRLELTRPNGEASVEEGLRL